jgi:hypothetical protein
MNLSIRDRSSSLLSGNPDALIAPFTRIIRTHARN